MRHDTEPIRWGILATGKIARTFADDLALVDDAELVAVASRNESSAEAFAQVYDIPRAYGSYQALADDRDVDVVYVATPHALHHDNVMACFEGGKSVLCEKALTLNARDAEHLVAEARQRELFLMEAMWMRLNPNIRAIVDLVAEGRIGDVRSVHADFGFQPPVDQDSRLFDPALGASAALDIGIYPLTFVRLFLGEPEQMRSVGTLSNRGIDLAVATAMTYASGATAVAQFTMNATTPSRAYIAGTRGYVEVEPRFWSTTGFSVVTDDGRSRYGEPLPGHGYTHEIDEVQRCLRAGLTESPVVPLDDTVAVMRQLDQLRADVGSVLPGDEKG